jgi:hypothetical protein
MVFGLCADSARELNNSVPAGLLRSVEAFIGLSQKLVKVLRVIGSNCDAQADPGGNQVRGCADRFRRYAGAKALRQRNCLLHIATRSDDQKFFASISSDRIVRPNYCLHPSHCFLEHSITNIVAVCVIRSFEVIQIRHDHRYARSAASRSAHLLLQGFADGAATEATGQKIMRCLKAQLFAGKSESILQFQDAFSGTDSSLQFLEIKRLGDIVVRTCLEALYDLFLLAFNREQNYVDVGLLREFPYGAADFDAV